MTLLQTLADASELTSQMMELRIGGGEVVNVSTCCKKPTVIDYVPSGRRKLLKVAEFDTRNAQVQHPICYQEALGET